MARAAGHVHTWGASVAGRAPSPAPIAELASATAGSYARRRNQRHHKDETRPASNL